MWESVVLESATSENFSPRNLPYGVCMLKDKIPFVATRLGDVVIRLENFPTLPIPTGANSLLFLMKQSKQDRVKFRTLLKAALFPKDSLLFQPDFFHQTCFRMDLVTMILPCTIGDYTDFYASRNHAENVGHMYRGKDASLQPNWLHLPVGYHGRSSSVVVSPSNVVRPCGQRLPGPQYGPTEKLDFELEVGIFVGGEENSLGSVLSVKEARSRIFGFVLLNDWSARDVQTWEYVPLGPFCAKNFCTTISPWILPMEALEENDLLVAKSAQDPPVLPHLFDEEYAFPNLHLGVAVKRSTNNEEVVVSHTNMRNLHWTPAQMIAHHTSSGCNVRPGDLMGTGTISSETSYGSLLEATWNGTRSVSGLGAGFLRDEDHVRMFGSTQGVGFGDCLGCILPAKVSKL